MTAIADLTHEAAPDDRLARRNALVLSLTQALAGANNTVIVATGGIVGAMLAPERSLATLPVTAYVVGLWFGTLPMGYLARHFGRRIAFQIGTTCGVATGLICFYAVLQGSFALFCFGAFVSGLYAAAHQGYRFAAADTASDAFKPKAISWVLLGGVAAGIVGPQLIIFTKDMWPPFLFAVTYLVQASIAVVAAGVLGLLRIPKLAPPKLGEEGRPLREIVAEPRFVVAVACGIASYAMMNMVMTAAPLAMVECNHTVTDATLGLQWHVMAMFAPSFFTGHLISRFGVEKVTGAGLLLILASAAVSMAGIALWNFWLGLILLGVGWNFGFIGATTMVTQCHRPAERHKVQSFNDFLVFGSMAVGSFMSGQLLAYAGWAVINELVFPFVLAAGALLAWQMFRRPARVAS
jgi:MFS family permease